MTTEEKLNDARTIGLYWQGEAERTLEAYDALCRAFDTLEAAVDYWQRTALEHRALLEQILADTPHQHVKTEISTHLKKYANDTETTLDDWDDDGDPGEAKEWYDFDPDC